MAENDNRIDYIELPTRGIAPAKQFYSTVFGWRFEDYGPGYAAFNDGRLSGGLAADEKDQTAAPLVVLYSSNLEQVEAKIRAAGGRITKPIFSFPGGRRFHFADPSGNELAVWSDK